jgi:transposase-like protein
MSGRIEESVWEERRAWINKQQQSGLSVAHFCREHGLHARNFHAWRYRLGEGSVGSLASTGKVGSGRKKQQVFVQLPLPTAAVATAGSAAWVEVSLADGLVVRVPASNLAALQIVLNSLNRSGQERQHV